MTFQRAKPAVFARDEGRCLRCLRLATDVHHRKARGMGGTSDPDREYGMSNLVSLCRPCHDWVHAHPLEAYTQGWIVHSWDNPEDIVIDPPGWKLGADGSLGRVCGEMLF